jgi:hypothetical protein
MSRAGPSNSRAYPSFTRALSPANIGNTINAADTELAKRVAASQYATTWQQVADLVPVQYARVVRPHLASLFEHCERLASAQATLNRWRADMASVSRVPPAVSGHGKLPSLGVSKDFAENNKELFQPIIKNIQEHQANLTELCETYLAGQVEFYDSKVNGGQHLRDAMSACQNHFHTLTGRVPWPVTSESVDEGKTWGSSKIFQSEKDKVESTLPILFARVISIVVDKELAQKEKIAKKQKLKDAADVNMGEESVSTADPDVIKKMIDDKFREVAGSVRDIFSSMNTHLRDSLVERPWSTGSSSQTEDSGFCARGHRHPHQPSGPLRQTGRVVLQVSDQYEWRTQEKGFVSSPRVFKRQRQTSGSSPGFTTSSAAAAAAGQGQESSRREEIHRVCQEIVADRSWRYEFPSSYPDAILTLPFNIAFKLLYSRVSASTLELAKYRGGVHSLVELEVPSNVAIHLSCGSKFLLFDSLNKKLPSLAYKTWVNTLRWKYVFRNEKNDTYDPDFDTGERSTNIAPLMPEAIELGIQKGQECLDKQVSSIPPGSRSKDHELVSTKLVEKWVKENDAIILNTDKNLGIAVVTRSWYLSQCYSIVDNPLDYKRIPAGVMVIELIELRRKIGQLFREPALEELNVQLPKWIVSCCPSTYEGNDMLSNLPRFYCIPKIHKNPWKMRPIIPCHSTMQGPTAKLLSKWLKPIVDKQPYVLKGTKHLVQQLSKIALDPYKKYYLVSGDVVAFYPNIPRDKAKDIAFSYLIKEEPWSTALFQRSAEEAIETPLIKLLASVLDIANDQLFTVFQDQYYEQLRGLAMGVACSPDMANLYGSFFENSLIPEIEGIIFYCRYIDDVFAIVEAPSLNVALNRMQRLQFDSCEITWSGSDLTCIFLDLFIYIDPWTNQIGYKPYKKAMNHHERIPWASHHPIDVKRGTVIGEITRLATLSSSISHFESALADLRKMYLARGYPIKVLNKWFTEHANKRWITRLENVPVKESNVHVLKTVFNPVWQFINIHDVSTAILAEWDKVFSQELESASRSRGPVQTTLALKPGPLKVRKPRKRKVEALESHNWVRMGSDAEDESSDDDSSASYRPGPILGLELPPTSSSAESFPLTTLLNKPLLVSRKRRLNLSDLMSAWRKTVLRYNDKVEISPFDLDDLL